MYKKCFCHLCEKCHSETCPAFLHGKSFELSCRQYNGFSKGDVFKVRVLPVHVLVFLFFSFLLKALIFMLLLLHRDFFFLFEPLYF